MRTFIAATLAASLLATPVFAGDQPLPSGKPAGITAAQGADNTFLYVVAVGAIVAGAVLLATNSSGNGNLTPGTTTTST